MSRLFPLEEEGLFRTAVGFLCEPREYAHVCMSVCFGGD